MSHAQFLILFGLLLSHDAESTVRAKLAAKPSSISGTDATVLCCNVFLGITGTGMFLVGLWEWLF